MYCLDTEGKIDMFKITQKKDDIIWYLSSTIFIYNLHPLLLHSNLLSISNIPVKTSQKCQS